MSSTTAHLDCGKLNCKQCIYIVLEEATTAFDEEMEASSQASHSNNNGLEDIIFSEDETLEGK